MKRVICNIIIRVLILSFAFPASGFANIEDRLFKEVYFDCRIYALLDDVETALEETFKVGFQGRGGHGGEGFEFQDNRQKIVGMADGIWLGLTWWVDGEMVGKTVFAQSHSTVEHRALILYNPKDEDHQLSLDCRRVEK